tara:strand:+ start:372 stop:542 length:171 start_codon:yes stop_codon:yes gene_type:complete
MLNLNELVSGKQYKHVSSKGEVNIFTYLGNGSDLNTHNILVGDVESFLVEGDNIIK